MLLGSSSAPKKIRVCNRSLLPVIEVASFENSAYRGK
jgi:hypothetical protein